MIAGKDYLRLVSKVFLTNLNLNLEIGFKRRVKGLCAGDQVINFQQVI